MVLPTMYQTEGVWIIRAGEQGYVLIPLLSSREPGMEKVHDAGQLREPGTQAREVEEHHPGPEQTPEDKRLKNEPQVVLSTWP